MKNICLCLLFVALLFSSCGKPSLEEDAQKAAGFTNISNQRASDNDYQGAEKYYKDAQEIIDKYRGGDNFRDFFSLYNGYLEAGVYQQMGGDLESNDVSSKSENSK